MPSQKEITRWLAEWSEGDPDALKRLMPAVFEDLHRLAAAHFARESPGHTLQPTAVIHEVYLKLLDSRTVRWANRAQFFGHASRVLDISARTVKRDWRMARIWLFERLQRA